MIGHIYRIMITIVYCLLAVPSETQTKVEKNGWRLGVQSYSFHLFPLTEALDKTQELGLRYIEIYPGHKLGGKWGDRVFDFNLDAQTQERIKELVTSKGIKIVGVGVYVAEKSSNWEKMLKFAKAMDLEFITCEPALGGQDLVEKLSKQYNIKISVYNHPQPSDYWKPENLLRAISGRSQSLGSCSDVGYWRRERLNQIDRLKRLRGRIIFLHFKDIAPKRAGENEQYDMIWDAGVLDAKRMLKELRSQNLKRIFSIEYEYNQENSVPDIKEYTQYFSKTANEVL